MDMKQCLKIIPVILLAVFICALKGRADTVLLHSGDRLIGTVQNRYLALQIPYGQIVINNGFLKRVSLPNRHQREVKVQTINNDLFNGTILNDDIQIELQTGAVETLGIGTVKLIRLDTSGPSYPITTTIFTTQNNDRFSGKFLNLGLRIEADFATSTFAPEDINRIEFTGNTEKDVRVLMSNGEIIEGRLKVNDILIAPDSLARQTADKSELSSIQFNARKMVLREFDTLPASEKDGDGDGVIDDSDRCPNTPWGSKVDAIGCPKGPVAAQLSRKKTDRPDPDNDGVPNPLDQCPQTPRTASVDENGCWRTPDILFDFDSAIIKPRYQSALAAIISVLNNTPALKIEIQGNTDNIGPESYNQMLSEKRARVVKDYIVSRGIDSERLKAVGFGATRSVASNEDEAGRALNRRIDFVPIISPP
jgi:outer membrane protein OmpA-like peptidoglycan-associated protein